MAMINRTYISSKHSMLIDLGAVFINKIVIKVTKQSRMRGVEMWAKRTMVIKVWKGSELLT